MCVPCLMIGGMEEEKDTRFVVVTPVFDCADVIVQTILSVVEQSFQGWRMLIRDDMSTDAPVARIKGLVSALESSNTIMKGQIKLTVNAEKHGEVRNTLEAAKEIASDEVIVRLDGGDWL